MLLRSNFTPLRTLDFTTKWAIGSVRWKMKRRSNRPAATDDTEKRRKMKESAIQELDNERFVREYYRKIAYELPFLSKFVKPFSKQNDAFLRFAYTARTKPTADDNKVSLTFHPDAIPSLDQPTIHALKLIADDRYDSSTGILTISCDTFPTALQNKRSLAVTFNKLIDKAREYKIKFADIPLRERKPLKRDLNKIPIPKSWFQKLYNE
ncbi:ribosomal protein subunit S24 [Schizosaccharomyces japonicus yFS275]|uniref:Ribosomal protein subunit S24 n=1 Tax=Schizosaccharomyces japonicus (strain yFS275 / FY16936) TaxID=402676 RepID=B6JY61_SCHJY|nr:ribosomal protein subunit S24 [Schizosaccharomyces japonicus yFS275]EEB06479.2 ribosomal protein subunit S24 [Schizosaccharomyces japonicus yFS275]